MAKRTEIRIAGFGGQGVIIAGQILGKAAAYDGKHVVQTQSYGAEARGSAARSEVIISSDEATLNKIKNEEVGARVLIGFLLKRKLKVKGRLHKIWAIHKNMWVLKEILSGKIT